MLFAAEPDGRQLSFVTRLYVGKHPYFDRSCSGQFPILPFARECDESNNPSAVSVSSPPLSTKESSNGNRRPLVKAALVSAIRPPFRDHRWAKLENPLPRDAVMQSGMLIKGRTMARWQSFRFRECVVVNVRIALGSIRCQRSVTQRSRN